MESKTGFEDLIRIRKCEKATLSKITYLFDSLTENNMDTGNVNLSWVNKFFEYWGSSNAVYLLVSINFSNSSAGTGPEKK